MRVLIVVGTWPEAIGLAQLIIKIVERFWVVHSNVHSVKRNKWFHILFILIGRCLLIETQQTVSKEDGP